jgi:hypothetical protein
MGPGTARELRGSGAPATKSARLLSVSKYPPSLQLVPSCECDELFLPAEEEQVSAYEECAGSQFGKGSEGCVNLVGGTCAHDMQLKSEGMRPVLQHSRFGLGIAIVWVDQQSNDGCLWRHFV